MRKLIAGAAMAACCTAASADIWYQWQTLNANGATVPIDGQLRIQSTAWMAGSINYTFDPTGCTMNPAGCAPGQTPGDLSSPIVSFSFYVDGEAFNWINENFRDGLGFGDGQLATFQLLGLGADIDAGVIGSGGSVAPIYMTGTGGVWTIEQIYGERNAPFGLSTGPCWKDACAGITGQWVQFISDPQELPSPATLPLVLLGLAGASAVARRLRT